ncbi:MAG TPA: hypothetical protein VFJ15_01565 [Oleiagrimonas sp.]|nr:hypothetical protein [Oleiagrimonas sp.]
MNVLSLQRRKHADTLYEFVTCAAQLLASDDEVRRRDLERRLQAMLPRLRGTPALEVLQIRDPALRAMLNESSEHTSSTTHEAAGNRVAYMAY